ncbi:MAG: MFS transporter [Gemmataceae bacterium]|nr:MFS transporter [Gemmataceae bacterium]
MSKVQLTAKQGSDRWPFARALAHRNYRLFFAGQGISMIGTWMTRLATGWLVFRLAGPDSAYLLGVVGFAGQVPTFFLAPIAGTLVDRWDRHRALVITQVLALFQSGLLAVVAFSSQAVATTIAEVIALSVFQGLINAFDMPARQAFLVELVERREDLPNAIALNSSLVNGARLVGPSLAGLLIALAGEGWCFAVDAVSYLAVIAALLAMRVDPRQRSAEARPVWRGVAEGFRYAFGFAPVREILLLLALVSFMGMPYTVLLPIFAVDVLDGGPWTLGLLSGASGVGALAGGLYLASRRTVLGLGPRMVLATVVFGVGLIGFSLSHALWLSLPLMVLIGLGMMVEMAASNTILQTIVDEDKRGRVMSFYSMAFLGMAPFGSLFAGSLAGLVGAPTTVLIGGIACLAGAGLFASRLPQLRERVRPIYARLGILPQIASGLQAAAELTRPPED